MSYVDWEYYSSLYDIIPEIEFQKYYKAAETKLNAVTHMRAYAFMNAYDEEHATAFQKQVAEQIKTTVCELIRVIRVQDISEMGLGIASVSNDGYSESYKIITAAEKEAQLLVVIRSGLSGTGLAGAL